MAGALAPGAGHLESAADGRWWSTWAAAHLPSRRWNWRTGCVVRPRGGGGPGDRPGAGGLGAVVARGPVCGSPWAVSSWRVCARCWSARSTCCGSTRSRRCWPPGRRCRPVWRRAGCWSTAPATSWAGAAAGCCRRRRPGQSDAGVRPGTYRASLRPGRAAAESAIHHNVRASRSTRC